jgi:prepilin-type N-terminal cleavage/methylation domain-containing protein
MARITRQAFTVVELLVVIAIIGVLMALLLPAVNYAREMARKATCSNNIRQFGLAAQSFESAKGYMPASRSYPPNLAKPASYTNTANAQSWVHPLLPYLEREDLYALIESLPANGSLGSLGFQNATIKLVHCPSDVSEYGGSNPNRCSYAVNGGRVNGSPNVTLPLDWPENGMFDDRLKGTSDQFRIFQTSKSDLARGDGASNTLAYVENSDATGWNVADNEFDVAVVWQPPGASPQTNPIGKNRRNQNEPMSWAYARPISFHTSGFNACFGDASVRYLSDSIDYAVYAQLMTSNGRNIKDPSSDSNSIPNYLPVLNETSY